MTTKITRDLLPTDVEQRQKIIQSIIQVFRQHNYREIVTPTFESFDNLSRGLGKGLAEAAFRFFDHSGNQMILRPDITTQVARVVSTRVKEKGPLRYYYSGDVYRSKGLEIGQSNQFHQIGIELFDLAGEKGEAEVLAIAEACLKKIGLKDFRVEKTDVRKLLKLPVEKREALLRQDFVAFGRLPQQEELLAPDIDYYTGLYFECYVPELGYILGAGGRYDNLCEVFGPARKAVGFAFNLDKLVQALEAQK